MLTGLEDDLSEEQLLLLLLLCLDDNLHAYNGIDVERLNWTRWLLVLICRAESLCTADKLNEDGRCGTGGNQILPLCIVSLGYITRMFGLTSYK